MHYLPYVQVHLLDEKPQVMSWAVDYMFVPTNTATNPQYLVQPVSIQLAVTRTTEIELVKTSSPA
jgi:hypothetical protein